MKTIKELAEIGSAAAYNTPPTSDGKTPGQVAFEGAGWGHGWASSTRKDHWQRAASAVLAAFGQAKVSPISASYEDIAEKLCSLGWTANNDAQWEGLRDALPELRAMLGGQASLEAGIERMETVTMDEIFHAFDHQKGVTSDKLNAVRAHLISAAREDQSSSQPAKWQCDLGNGEWDHDWKEIHDSSGELGGGPGQQWTYRECRVCGAIDSQETKPAEIQWIEWKGGECPLKDEEVEKWEWKSRGDHTHMEFVPPSALRWHYDGSIAPRCPECDIIAYRVTKWRIKPESTFEAHDQTWTEHTPGDPMPCDGEAMVQVLLACEKAEGMLGEASYCASHWDWTNNLDMPCFNVVGWRYADKPKAEPSGDHLVFEGKNPSSPLGPSNSLNYNI